eukprot:c11367_g1_i1 orf=431-898(+)
MPAPMLMSSLPLQGEVEALSDFQADHFQYALLDDKLNKEKTDEANHGCSRVPPLCSLRESPQCSWKLGLFLGSLHPWWEFGCSDTQRRRAATCSSPWGRWATQRDKRRSVRAGLEQRRAADRERRHYLLVVEICSPSASVAPVQGVCQLSSLCYI